MMLRFLLCFALPIQILRIQDIEFNHYLNDVLVSVGAIGYFLPKYFKQEKFVKLTTIVPILCVVVKLDQRNILSPNNFVKMNPSIPK